MRRPDSVNVANMPIINLIEEHEDDERIVFEIEDGQYMILSSEVMADALDRRVILV